MNEKCLFHKVSIYLPSHNRSDISQLMKKMALIFGGCTAHKADGAWLDGGKLILDPITVCISYSDMLGPTTYDIARDLARSITIEYNQECVSLEFNDCLYFIGKD